MTLPCTRMYSDRTRVFGLFPCPAKFNFLNWTKPASIRRWRRMSASASSHCASRRRRSLDVRLGIDWRRAGGSAEGRWRGIFSATVGSPASVASTEIGSNDETQGEYASWTSRKRLIRRRRPVRFSSRSAFCLLVVRRVVLINSRSARLNEVSLVPLSYQVRKWMNKHTAAPQARDPSSRNLSPIPCGRQ